MNYPKLKCRSLSVVPLISKKSFIILFIVVTTVAMLEAISLDSIYVESVRESESESVGYFVGCRSD